MESNRKYGEVNPPIDDRGRIQCIGVTDDNLLGCVIFTRFAISVLEIVRGNGVGSPPGITHKEPLFVADVLVHAPGYLIAVGSGGAIGGEVKTGHGICRDIGPSIHIIECFADLAAICLALSAHIRR